MGSELEEFLKQQAASGSTDSRGQFTVNQSRALRKMGSYQLPFEGAWAVKVIQSMVVGGSGSSTRVDLTASEFRFFVADLSFSLEQLEDAFADPAGPTNRSLEHLLSGLRAIASKGEWGFQVALPQDSTTLIWDGNLLHRVRSKRSRDCASVVVAPLQGRRGVSWIAGLAASAKRNSELLLTLAKRCYLCPVPLTVDGRRLDSLQRGRLHSLSQQVYPFTMGCADGDLPQLPLSPGSFGRVAKSLDPRETRSDLLEPAWSGVGQRGFKAVDKQDSAALAYVVCTNFRRIRSGDGYAWQMEVGPSTIYWALDGALVGEEPLTSKKSWCSVALFLSAEGLKTDVSSLALRESTEKKERIAKATEILEQALGEIEASQELATMLSAGSQAGKVLGGSLVVTGVATIWAAPMLGMSFLAAGGAAWYARGGGAERARLVRKSLGELREALAPLPPKGS